jgi:hypothetical protein
MQQVAETIKEEALSTDDLDEFISECFDRGTHVSCSLVEAYKLYRLWAQRNRIPHPLGRNTLGNHLHERPGISKKLTANRVVRLHGITPKEARSAPPTGRDAQYKDERDDD